MKTHANIVKGILFLSIMGLTSLMMLLLPSFQSVHNDPEQFSIPKIVGIEDITTLCLSPAYMLNAWYDIERIDTITDVLDLTSPSKDQNTHFYQFHMPESLEDLNTSNLGLQVVADTVNELSMTKKPIWASYLFHNELSGKNRVLQDDTLIQQVKSFPIYVANMSKNQYASLETQDGSIVVIVEAVDREGQWKPIEYWSHSWCGNSYYTMMIPPRHMLMTRGIKCSGDFYTTCRLKLSNSQDSIFSNEFQMSINETQFSMPLEKDR
jgi:hypothetical protein